MWQELPDKTTITKSPKTVDEASLIVNGLNFAVNLEILRIVQDSLQLSISTNEKYDQIVDTLKSIERSLQ